MLLRTAPICPAILRLCYGHTAYHDGERKGGQRPVQQQAASHLGCVLIEVDTVRTNVVALCSKQRCMHV